MSGLLRRTFCYLNKHTFLLLYKTLVRPHLEYAVQAWCPYYQKDIKLIENIQKRTTKMLPEIRDWSYEERLQFLGLQKLEDRRRRADLVLIFQMFNGTSCLSVADFFDTPTHGRTRGHHLKIRSKAIPATNSQRYFFSHRSVEAWNGLPAQVVASPSLAVFKSRLHETGF